MKNVCIIGAGAAGLAAIRHVSDSKMTGVVFERTDDIGGTWNYTDKVGVDQNTGDLVHSSAYKGLRTNLPKEIMGFLDYEMVGNGKYSFIYHPEVLQYLRNYAKHFNLLRHIQFNTRVISINPVYSEAPLISGKLHWEVTVARNGTNETFNFDAVMICNGHFSKPQIPDIQNLDTFKGDVIHSRDYRVPGIFLNKRVVVLGCGPSGIDIALEIAQVALGVVISMRNPPYPGTLSMKVRQVCPIRMVKDDYIIFEDGEELLCDTLLLCTGYEYELPFLSPECGLKIEKGKRISSLYKQMINTKYPTMSLIGIPFRVCPFLLFDAQVRYFVSYLEGRLTFPSEEEMQAEINEEMQRREVAGIPFSRSHQLEDLQWDYYKSFGEAAGFSHLLKPSTRSIYEQVAKRRREVPEHYKDDQVVISGDTAVLKQSKLLL